jgi:hypothetical protein
MNIPLIQGQLKKSKITQEEKMTQNCPLCGKPVYPVRNPDPDSLTGRFYFCAATPESCRATFMIPSDGEYSDI